MPKNYQISQYDEPLCFDGYLDIEVDGRTVRIEIERVHLEEDTGKSTHMGGATGRIHGADYSIVDYNRAGIPLVEIVTKPIPGTERLAPEVAKAYVTELREVMRSLGVSDVRMEEGSMRCDVNVSLMPRGAVRVGHPYRDQERQLAAQRRAGGAQRDRAAGGGAVRRRPDRAGDPALPRGHRHTTSGRSKEEAQDYRYFPEPDLVPIAPDPAWVAELKAALPELPSAKRQRLQAEWGLSDLDMQAMHNADAIDLVEATVAAGAPAADARKWWMGELARRSNETGVALADLPITPAQIARVTVLVASGALNDKLAREVLEGVLAGEGTPDEVVEQRGLKIVSDDGELSSIIDEVHRGQRRRRREGPLRQDRRRGRAGRRRHEGQPRQGRRRSGARADPGEAGRLGITILEKPGVLELTTPYAGAPSQSVTGPFASFAGDDQGQEAVDEAGVAGGLLGRPADGVGEGEQIGDTGCAGVARTGQERGAGRLDLSVAGRQRGARARHLDRDEPAHRRRVHRHRAQPEVQRLAG